MHLFDSSPPQCYSIGHFSFLFFFVNFNKLFFPQVKLSLHQNEIMSKQGWISCLQCHKWNEKALVKKQTKTCAVAANRPPKTEQFHTSFFLWHQLRSLLQPLTFPAADGQFETTPVILVNWEKKKVHSCLRERNRISRLEAGAASSWTMWRTECRTRWSHTSHSLHCKEFHFLPSEGNEVSVTAWWMVFLCARCLRSEIIPCGREACGVLFFFSSHWSAAAISAAPPLHWLWDRAAVSVDVSFW